ncbi:MAG TPA: hypothetical protein VMX17_10675 [Candidatus Glassbacteria bacterium]|nr:hypothetical protein [Candidatus Glassbacteria bacterium]
MDGGQLDVWEYRPVDKADNYSDASEKYVNSVDGYLSGSLWSFDVVPDDFLLFAADYALYWFNYLAGYDVVLAEFGWNYSGQLNAARCRCYLRSFFLIMKILTSFPLTS